MLSFNFFRHLRRSFELVKTFERLFLFLRRFQNGYGSKITEQFMVMPKTNLIKFQVRSFVNFLPLCQHFVNIFMLSRPPGATWTRY